MNKSSCIRTLSLATFASLLCALSANLHAQGFTFAADAQGVLVKESGRPVFFYQKATKSLNGAYPRANYVHPLYGPDGEVLTEDFPEDHLHHRGIFWAWHQLIVDGNRIGDPWECRGLTWNVTKVDISVVGENAHLEASINWEGDVAGETTAVVKEKTTIITYPAANGQRSIDFEIQLTAGDRDVWLGGSEDAKGYSGFSARIKLPNDVAFSSDNGTVIPRETAVKAGGWIDITASFEGVTSGVVLMADTTTLQPFHGWILRSQKSMQNAAFPGRQPVKIAAGETLHMRYRLVVHERPMAAAEIQQLYVEFMSAQPRAKK